MTSKALEAAAQVLVTRLRNRPGFNLQWLMPYENFGPHGLDPEGKAVWDEMVSDIIRAFAENLSEEAVKDVVGRVRYEKVIDVNGLRGWRVGCREQILAAIEKDLE